MRKFVAIILFLILVLNLKSQDKLKINLANLWWDNEIELFDYRNKKLNDTEAIFSINNQRVATNCGSNLYRYTQNTQQPSGEKITFHTLENCKVIRNNEKEFRVTGFVDEDTGEERIAKLFSYKLIDKKRVPEKSETNLNTFFNKKMRISKIMLNDSLVQFLDQCHARYSIVINSDGTFEQGYENDLNCTCDISTEEFTKIHHIGFAKFSKANHALLGKSGMWKTHKDKLYLKFPDGNLYKYNYKIIGSELFLKEYLTTIILKEDANNNH